MTNRTVVEQQQLFQVFLKVAEDLKLVGSWPYHPGQGQVFFKTGVTAAVFNLRGTTPVFKILEMRSEIGREITGAEYLSRDVGAGSR